MVAKKASKNVLVIIGDIKQSRSLKSRAEVQKRFKKFLDLLNKKNKNILSPYTITVGDEFQVVLKKADGLFRDLFFLMGEMHPVKLRFSIAVGRLSTAINRESAIGMDGSAFHLARKGIDELKKGSFIFSVSVARHYHNSMNFEFLTTTLVLVSLYLRNWKALRYRLVAMLLEQKEVPEIAQSLGVTTRSVYKNIEFGVLELWQSLSARIENELNEVLEQK